MHTIDIHTVSSRESLFTLTAESKSRTTDSFHLNRLEISMAQCQFGTDAMLGISCQHFPQEIHSFRINVFVPLSFKTKIHLFVFFVHLVIFRPLEECLLD
jgi:hypothetical protein